MMREIRKYLANREQGAFSASKGDDVSLSRYFGDRIISMKWQKEQIEGYKLLLAYMDRELSYTREIPCRFYLPGVRWETLLDDGLSILQDIISKKRPKEIAQYRIVFNKEDQDYFAKRLRKDRDSYLETFAIFALVLLPQVADISDWWLTITKEGRQYGFCEDKLERMYENLLKSVESAALLVQ